MLQKASRYAKTGDGVRARPKSKAFPNTSVCRVVGITIANYVCSKSGPVFSCVLIIIKYQDMSSLNNLSSWVSLITLIDTLVC